MNKVELNEKIVEGRRLLDTAVAKISDERMDRVILHGEWSVKDMLGHLGFWEERVVNLFEVLHSGSIPEPMADMNALNDQAVIDYRKLELAEVREAELGAFQRVLTVVERASEVELFNPGYFAWAEGRAFYEFIEDNTCGHYEEHLIELTAWLKRIA